MIVQATRKNALNSWLSEINREIDGIRRHRLASPRPTRDRARERARREARQLFRDYEIDRALACAS